MRCAANDVEIPRYARDDASFLIGALRQTRKIVILSVAKDLIPVASE